MQASFASQSNTFTIENFNCARPFSSFLPGIAGQDGKPMWVFYTNRGQCISSFGVGNKDGAMMEFFPANKAYAATPLLGFQTFIRVEGPHGPTLYEPFGSHPQKGIQQWMRIRPHEIDLEEVNPHLHLRVRMVAYNAPSEKLPVLVRRIEIENLGNKPVKFEVLDGLPRIVPFGLNEFLLKKMSRTMEAFAEVTHTADHLPFFKLKVEPSDKPDIEWVVGGFFSFTLSNGRISPVLIDPEAIFAHDTSCQIPLNFLMGLDPTALPQRTESLSACSFSVTKVSIPAGKSQSIDSYYGQANGWEDASVFRKKIQKTKGYFEAKRTESERLVSELTDTFAVHSGVDTLDGYSRQCFLDNTLRGGQPFIVEGPEGPQVFHYYSRKHGDMERDYNFFELSPTYFSQGNGNYRDINQNRRSEVLFYPGLKAGNIETFLNLVQLDGYNPLVIQFERFYIEEKFLSAAESVLPPKSRSDWRLFLSKPFNPGELFERLIGVFKTKEAAYKPFVTLLGKAKKIQDAVHGEGFWIDHWTYNLDLIENFTAVYPDQLRALFVERRDFTYYDNDHIVLPRHRKYVRRADGAIRQFHSVVCDPEKKQMIAQRKHEPHQVRTDFGKGPVYRTTLLEKVLNLVAIKAATLDPFGMGIEMESEKPGWCDALNGLPGLMGSSVNEAFELRRWIAYLKDHLNAILKPNEAITLSREVGDLLVAVRVVLSLADHRDFFKTWDKLSSLREQFREKTRLGLSGDITEIGRDDIDSFLQSVDRVLEKGLQKAFRSDGLCTTYFINEVTRYESLPAAAPTGLNGNHEPVASYVLALEFKQTPVSPFLEGPVHALRGMSDPKQGRKLYEAVKQSDLYDRVLKMYKLNVPLTKESFEIGRNKIFTPGWLENESVFLHMAYKYMLETLRIGLVDEFFEDLKHGLVAFQDPKKYGRSNLENSSFIASSRFPDKRLHGAGFVARLTGATAEWISMVFHMGLGSEPFRYVKGELRFEPVPVLSKWLFSETATTGFKKNTFGFKLFGRTWIVYHNPSRRDTYRGRRLFPSAYTLRYSNGKEITHEGRYLPESLALQLREGRFERVTIELE